MSLRTHLLRVGAGILVMSATLFVCFAVFMAQMPHWGATGDEANQALSGDEILGAPQVDWTNARTIQAPPEDVLPWLAQA